MGETQEGGEVEEVEAKYSVSSGLPLHDPPCTL